MKIGDALARGLRLLRTERGLTQAELAERADLHVQFISQLERRARGITLDKIDPLAEALGVTAPDLIAVGAAQEARPRKADALAHRVRRVLEAWPPSEQDRLVEILRALGTMAARSPTLRRRR